MTYGTYGTLKYKNNTFTVKGEILNMSVNSYLMTNTMHKVIEWASNNDVLQLADPAQVQTVEDNLLQCRIHHLDSLINDLEFDVEFIDFYFDIELLLLHVELQIC